MESQPTFTPAPPVRAASEPAVFSWTRSGNSTLHQLLIVTDDTVHLTGMLSGRLAKKMANALSEGNESIEERLGKATHGKAISIPRSAISELSWVAPHKRLEIAYSDKVKKIVFDDAHTANDVAEGLSAVLGVGQRSTEKVDSSDQYKAAAPTVAAAVAFAALFVFLDAVAEQNYVATGRRQGLKQLVNDLMLALPAIVVWLGAAAIVAGAIHYTVETLRSEVDRTRVAYRTH